MQFSTRIFIVFSTLFDPNSPNTSIMAQWEAPAGACLPVVGDNISIPSAPGANMAIFQIEKRIFLSLNVIYLIVKYA